MSTWTQRLLDQVSKPAIHGGIGGLLMGIDFPGAEFTLNSEVPGLNALNGYRMNAMVYGAVAGFATSFIVEAIHNTILATRKGQRLSHLPSFILHVVGGAGVTALFTRLFNRNINKEEVLVLARTGVIGEILSEWFYANFLGHDSIGSELLGLV